MISGIAIFLSEIIITVVTTKVKGEPFSVLFFYHNMSPLAILMAICFFKYFISLQVKGSVFSKFLTVVGSCTFGIFLVHWSPFAKHLIFPFLKQYAYSAPLTYTLVTIGAVLAIFIGCAIIDYVRQKLFKLLKVRKLCDIVVEKAGKVFSKVLKIKKESE